MAVDPVKRRAGHAGGLATARRKFAHLSDAEIEVKRELERQARSYAKGEHGSPSAVAAWLRGLADRLDSDA